jgi:hypothetical protein
MNTPQNLTHPARAQELWTSRRLHSSTPHASRALQLGPANQGETQVSSGTSEA